MVRSVVFFCISIFWVSTYAQSDQRFIDLKIRDGLSSGSVTSIVQDSKGLIWIGTKQGFNRYDGRDFIHFHSGNSVLESNDVSSLLVDAQDQLWIGTHGGGLYVHEGKTQKISRYLTEGIGDRIKSITASDHNGLWVISELGLASIGSSNSWETQGLPAEVLMHVSTIEPWDNSLWLGTSDGQLLKIEKDGSYVTFNDQLGAKWPGVSIHKMKSMDGKKLLIGTRQHGLLVFDSTDDNISNYPIEAQDIRDMLKDGVGDIWVGTDGNGVYHIQNNQMINYRHQTGNQNSLVSNAVHECFEDRDGNLWFGTAWDGISLIDSRSKNLKFVYSDFLGIERAGILNVYVEDHQLWLGTDGRGLSVQDPSVLAVDVTRVIPTDAYVQFIDKFDGKYWIGTFQSGLFIVEDKQNGTSQHFTSNSGLSHDDVRDVVQLDDDSYLIASWGGGLTLYEQSTTKFRKIGTGKRRPIDVVVLERLNDEKILVGTFGQGAFVFQTSDFSLTPILPDLQNVVSIEVAKKGAWFGTWGEGLHYAEPPFVHAQLIQNEEFKANSNVFSIIASTQSDQIWAATNEKILSVSGNGEVKGLPLASQQFHFNSANRDSEGRCYFGSTEGVISFKSEDLDFSSNKEVKLTEVKILDKTLKEFEVYASGGEFLELAYDHNMLTFRFSTPVYPSSRAETHEVALEPVNADWVEVGLERSMTYADLNPGNYRFKVRNSSSVIEEYFEFRIRNPWWKTWWAYSLLVSLFLGLLYFFRQYSIRLERMKNQLEIEKMGREQESEINSLKQKFFVNVSHEIRTPLTLIIGEIEQLAIKTLGSKGLSGSINNLRNNGNHMIQLVNELLDFRKLDQGGMRLKVSEGNFVLFCKEIYLSFYNKAEANSIDYQFTSETHEIQAWYDRDQLEKVFYNLLANAFKNTSAGGRIEVTVAKKIDCVEVAIRDSGKGIPNEEIEHVFRRFYQNEDVGKRSGFGIGLSIVQDIVNLHKGTVSVESTEGKGSCFTVRLGLGSDHFNEDEMISESVNSDSLDRYTALELNPETELSNGKKEDLILVVEDNPDIRQFIVKLLSYEFEVLEAADGQAALEIAKSDLPDLVVSDIMMPVMDGIRLTMQLKDNPSTSHIPIILLTARTGTIFKKEGYETGADDYITKPFNSMLLITRIENILDSRRRLADKVKNDLAIRPNDLNLASPDERFLKELVGVIESNLDNSEMHADLISTEMGMSHSVVYKKIKALTGCTLVEFIRDYRLQQAADMLLKYKFSIAEACYKVGFSDKKYFSQMFKKKYGKTPSEYAKE